MFSIALEVVKNHATIFSQGASHDLHVILNLFSVNHAQLKLLQSIHEIFFSVELPLNR